MVPEKLSELKLVPFGYLFLIDLRLTPAGKNKSSPATGATLPAQLLGLLKVVGGCPPVHVRAVAAETVLETLRPETSNAKSKRRVTMWENDDLPELDFGTAVNPPNKFLKRDGLMVFPWGTREGTDQQQA